MQRSTSVFLLLFILFSGNIDILGYKGESGGVIQTDSGSRSFLYSLGVILYYGLALGPLLSCPALRRASCNFNFCAQSLSFTVSWGGDGKRGDPPAWTGKKPHNLPFLWGADLSLCLPRSKDGTIPRPSGHPDAHRASRDCPMQLQW